MGGGSSLGADLGIDGTGREVEVPFFKRLSFLSFALAIENPPFGGLITPYPVPYFLL